MLPDLRFAVGAFLAMAVLGVAGLGVVTSVRLAREAHIAPLNDSRSLAYAGPAQWNQFYDPDNARRFAGAARGGSESAPAEPPRETPPAIAAEGAPVPAPPPALEQAASLGADQPASETAKIAPEPEPPSVAVVPNAPLDIVAEQPPEPEPSEPPQTAVSVTIVPTEDAPTLPDAAQASGPAEPPPDRTASLPLTTPEENRVQDAAPSTPAPAPAAALAPPHPAETAAPDAKFTPPTPRARPKLPFRRIARVRIRRPVAASPPTTQAPSFGAWPSLPSTTPGKAATR